MSNISVQSSFVNTLQARSIVGFSTTQSSAMHASGPIVGKPTVTTLLAAGGAVAAASLVNGVLIATPTGGPSTYTLPASAAVLAAFTAAGIPLITGDVFEVRVQNMAGANAALFAVGADIVAGNTLESIPAQKSALLIFRVVDATSASEEVTVYQMVSA
jgi:hypothetical protein